MATMFKKGDAVKLQVVIPQGEVEALRMDEDGVVYYQISWQDANGITQTRWFEEGQLIAV